MRLRRLHDCRISKSPSGETNNSCNLSTGYSNNGNRGSNNSKNSANGSNINTVLHNDLRDATAASPHPSSLAKELDLGFRVKGLGLRA